MKVDQKYRTVNEQSQSQIRDKQKEMVLHTRRPTRIFALLEGKKREVVHGGLLRIMKPCLVWEVPALEMIQGWDITQEHYAYPVFTSFPRCLLLFIILQKCFFCNLYPTAKLYPIDQTFPYFSLYHLYISSITGITLLQQHSPKAPLQKAPTAKSTRAPSLCLPM